MRSRYEEMLLEDVPQSNHFFASFFTWILLAGFLVLPGSFGRLETVWDPSQDARTVQHAAQNIHLYGSCPLIKPKPHFLCAKV
jgi:hypothetical protein